MARAITGKTTDRWFRKKSRTRRDWSRPTGICCQNWKKQMNKMLIRLSLAALLATLAGPAWSREALTPVHLRCEYVVDPMGVDVPHPRLFWVDKSRERGQNQSAYEILVASSAQKLANNQGDLWDSGKVDSDETIQIPYAGQPLKSTQQVFWKVHVWDNAGKASGWSKPATWIMGLFKANDPSSPS